MKLYILRPQDNLPEDDNPWEPWYDKAFGFIVQAETLEEARMLAHMEAGDENRKRVTYEEQTPWLDSRYSTCQELKPRDTSSVIMRDFASA